MERPLQGGKLYTAPGFPLSREQLLPFIDALCGSERAAAGKAFLLSLPAESGVPVGIKFPLADGLGISCSLKLEACSTGMELPAEDFEVPPAYEDATIAFTREKFWAA